MAYLKAEVTVDLMVVTLVEMMEFLRVVV